MFSHDLVLLVAGGAGALVAAVVTPVVARWAVKWDVVDRPDSRKHHETPVALLGGVSVLFSLMVVGAAAFWLTGEGSLTIRSADPAFGFLAGSAIGALILAVIGLWDDISPVPVVVKLAAQLISSAVFMAFSQPLAGMAGSGMAVVVATAWLLLMTNSFNLIDNMDGSAPGLGAIAATFLSVLTGYGTVGLVSAALAGALVGFLVFNRHPARVFLGDGGSLPIGFLLGAFGLWIAGGAGGFSLAVLLVLGVPLVDTSFVVVSRLRRGLNPLTTPGTDHLSHRLVSLGLPIPLAVVLLWAVGLGFGLAGLAVSPPPMIGAWIVAVGVTVVWVGAIVTMKRVAPLGLGRAGAGDPNGTGGVS